MIVAQYVATALVGYLAVRETIFVVQSQRTGYPRTWALLGSVIIAGIVGLGALVWL